MESIWFRLRLCPVKTNWPLPPLFSSESAVDSRELQELISRLPEGYGTVFRLSVIEGFSHKEIAGMQGIEPHSSSSQLTRAKALLRKMLDRKLWLIGILFVSVIPVYVYLSRQRPAKKDKLPLAEKKHADETPKRKSVRLGRAQHYRGAA